MTQEQHFKKLKAAIIAGNPSSIAEVMEARRPGKNVVQIYVLPDGTILDFSSDVMGTYTLPCGKVIEAPGLRPPDPARQK